MYVDFLRAIRPAFVAALALALGGCEVFGPQHSGETVVRAQIEFVAAGGFAGGVLQRLTITEDGLATNSLTKPALQQQLSEAEHQRLLDLFVGFSSLKDTYEETLCADDVGYTVTLQQSHETKIVSASGCFIYEHRTSSLDIARFSRIVEALSALASRIVEEEAPWLGLEPDFHLDNDTYGLGEPILLTYRIINPTGMERTLYFCGENRLSFSVYRQGVPDFHYTHPPPQQHSCAGELIPLGFQPGEEKTLTYTWDQHIVDREGRNSTLEVGRYTLSMRLLDSSHLNPRRGTPFEIIDRSVELAGYVEPDYNGQGSASPTYTFKLLVRNWTAGPVTLDFPYRQRLYVRLYDLDRPASDPLPLLYEGSTNLDEARTTLLLQPGEARVFEHTVPKAELNLTYLHYYVQIELLTSNLTFDRDSQLQISSYRPD